MKRHIALLPIALTLGFLQHVQAANPAPITEEVYKLAKDDLDQHYAREKLTCDSATGNAKDICKAEVSGAEKVAQARWTNVLDFIDWMARRCGGEITQDGGATFESERQTVLQVAQTISVIISLAERGDEQDVVTLSTLHAAKGLEWPHVVLAGVRQHAGDGAGDDGFVAVVGAVHGACLLQMPSWRAARSFMISSAPPPIIITFTSR